MNSTIVYLPEPPELFPVDWMNRITDETMEEVELWMLGDDNFSTKIDAWRTLDEN